MKGESEVPGAALNLISTNYPDHGHHGRHPLSWKNANGRAGNRIRDQMISSQELWPPSHEAGLGFKRLSSMYSQLFKSVLKCKFLIWVAIFRVLYSYVSKNFRVRRYFSKPKWIRERERKKKHCSKWQYHATGQNDVVLRKGEISVAIYLRTSTFLTAGSLYVLYQKDSCGLRPGYGEEATWSPWLGINYQRLRACCDDINTHLKPWPLQVA